MPCNPDAIYRLAIDNDGDLQNDIAFSYVFSEPKDGKQTVDVYLAANEDAESAEAVGEKIFSAVPVSFVGDEPHIATSDDFTFFAGARSDAFFFDFDGVKNLFDTSGKRNFTELTLPGESPWTGVDSNTQANVFSTAIEMPTSFLGADPDIRIWGRCSLRRDGELLHVDRAGHPSVSSFFNTDDTKEEYNASVPVNDRARWIDMFIHQMGHTGGYSREEAIEAIDNEGTLPGHADLQPVEAGEVPERPRVHRRRHRLSAGIPDQGRVPAVRPEPAHRHPHRVPVPGPAAPGELVGRLRHRQRAHT